MKHHFASSRDSACGRDRMARTPLLITAFAALAGILTLTAAACAAVEPVVVYQPAAGRANEIYVPSTQTQIVLQGTEKMSKAIVGDLDADGIADDLVYADSVNGGLGYYEMPRDGAYHREMDHTIPAPKDAIPLAILRTGGTGSPSVLIYNSATSGGTFAMQATGATTMIGKMNVAYAVDVRNMGYPGDLVWWASGVGMCWREGYAGTDHPTPWYDLGLIPLGGGKIASGQPTRTIAFYAKGANGIYICDGSWNWSPIGGTAWPWSINFGAAAFGDVDSDGLSELLYAKSSSDPLSYYNVPASPYAWDSAGVVTASSVQCGWGLRGVAQVDVGSVAPPKVVLVSHIADLAALADGTQVQIAPKPRTKLVREIGADSKPVATGYYIEETDRSAGVRVVGSTAAAEGQLVGVTGTLGTVDGERVVRASDETLDASNFMIAPLSATIDMLYSTPPMTGLLVQASGMISGANTASGWFNLTSGSRTVKVYCPDISTTSGNAKVTGCVGAEKSATGTVVPVLRIEAAADGVLPDGGTTPTPPPPTPTPTASFSTWTMSALDKVFKTDSTRTLQTTALKAARNEHEAFQVVLRADKTALSSVTVKAGDFVSGSGSRIPASNVSIYKESYIYLPGPGKDYPDPLPPYTAPFAMTQGQTQPLWIDVYVPKTAAAGDYNGTVTISTSNAGTQVAPVTLHVYNFTLPDTPKCATAFALRDGEVYTQHHVTPGSAQANALIRKYYDFCLSRGVSTNGIPYGTNLLSDDGAKLLTDPRMTSITLPYSSNASEQAAVINRFKQLGALDKAFVYSADEPYLLSQIDQVKSTASYIHGIDRNARVAVVFSDDVVATSEPAWTSGASYSAGQVVKHYEFRVMYWKNYLYRCKTAHTTSSATEPGKGAGWSQYWERMSIPKLLTGSIDLWVCGVSFWDVYADELAQRRAAGEEVWTYITLTKDGVQPNYFVDYASIFTRIIPWASYMNQTPGILYWCLDYWSETPNPWTDIDTGQKSVPGARLYGEGSLIYPGYQVGIDGPVSSVRLEVLRDGLEDYQYLWMLEQKLGRSGVMPYVNKMVSSWRSFNKDTAQLASVRDEIAQRIEN